MPESDELARIGDILDACRDDPALFNAAVLGRQLWSRQVEVCKAVAEYPITLVPAGRAVGKSYLLAGIVLWWLYTRPMSLVITTGPDHRQVVSVLWKEIRRCIRPHFKDGVRVSPIIDLGYDHLTEGYGSPQRLQLQAGTEWQALGFAAKSEEGFSGQHAGDLLVIVDEATGVAPGIWSAIHGLAASRLVVVGNPIRYDCHFRELNDLAEKGSESITSIRISSLECPDAGKETSEVGMASRSFLRQMREIHGGEDCPWWRSNILGFFPGAENSRFIPTAWLDACLNPKVINDELWRDHPDGRVWISVDVGGGVGADRSVVVVRNHKRLLEVFASEWYGVLDDARCRLEPVVLDLQRKWDVPSDQVIYDKGGLGRNFGSYLAKQAQADRDRHLRQYPDSPGGAPRLCGSAVGYFGAGGGGHLFINRRTANAYAVKKRLDPNRDGHVPFYCGDIPEWKGLRQELSELRAPTMEMEEGQVKQRLEDKADLAARLKRSPDLLDALLMSFTFSG